MKELEFFKLENRVLFEAAAAAEIVDAAEMAQNPDNANVSESAKQEQKDRDTLKNAPPENPAANQNDDVQVDPAEIADIDAVIEQLIEGEIPSVEADGIDIDADIDNDIIEAEADDFIDGEIVDNGLTISTDKELVVINSTVADKDAIIAELKPDQEVLILEDGNGLDELNEYLDNSDTKYSAIHFVTHGNDGYISVNGELIDSENFDAAQWQEIGEHLTEDGDILLYGCDTAATAEGKLLTEMISEASGADVAASVDATGISGDWDLEYTVGDVDVDEITVENFEHNLTNYTVTNLNDSGSGSLRQAVTDANANAGTDEITFSVDGTIKFNSEIKISDDVAIIGNGVSKTILDGKSVSRFFSIAKNVDVEISDMTLQNGKSKISGGAISNDGNLTIDNAVFLSNTSVSEGGAISNSGNLTVSDAIFRSNTTSGDGGAVYNGNGTVVISDTLFDSNSGSMGGGVYNTGIYNTPGNFVSVNNTWIQNKAGSGGGAIENQDKLVVVNNSFLNNNSSVHASLGQAVRNDGTAQIINSVYVNNTNKPDAQTAVKNISGNAEDLFANDGTPDADGEIYIKSGSAADGKGVYVWHNADYSAIAYSTTETGAKTAVVGDASKATIQLDNFNSAGKPNIGSGKTEEAQSLEVTTTADTVDSLDNLTSLREAIAYAAILGGNQTITFGVDGIFELDSELALNSNITIDGNGTDKTILDGQDACRIFNIDSSATVTISDMTIQNGYAAADDNTGAGGGIRNAGTLTVENMLFKDNLAASTSNGGGAIWNNNSLTVKSSEFVNNTALWCGGAIFANANTIVEDSVFADNTAGRYGNIVYISKPGSVTFNNSTLELGSGSKAIHANGKLNFINSTLTGDLTNSDRVLIDVENGAVTIVNSIVSGTGTGNSINVSSSASGSLKLYYSVVGTVNGTISTNVSSDTGIAPDQIFSKLDSSGIPVTESDGTFAIILGGKAHKTGAFVWHNADYSAIAYSSSATGSKTAISGSTSSATTLVDTDQAGKTRGDFADRGAYELLNDGKEESSLIVTTTSDVENAYDGVTSLREAIAYAESKEGADEITFSVDGTFKFDSEITISTDITFTGNGTDKTIFDGQAKTRLFTINSGVTVKMSDLTIQGGYVSGYQASGGAIYNNGTLTVDGCSFLNNKVYSTSSSSYSKIYGGAIYNNGTLTATNSTFASNSATQTNMYAYGGAVCNEGTFTATGCSFIQNTASGYIAYAGAIYSIGTLSITDCSFTENSVASKLNQSAHAYGGAIYNTGAISITDSVFIKNKSTAGLQSHGGAIYSNAELDVSDSYFIENNAYSGSAGGQGTGCGGAIYSASSLTVTDCLFSKNSTFSGNESRTTAFAYGGAIFSYRSPLCVINSTFVDNSATASTQHNNTNGSGGAIYQENLASSFFSINNTFTGNIAYSLHGTYNGGAICTTYTGSKINLINNIIVGNEGGSEVDGAKNSDINNLYTSTDVTVANTFAEVDADGKAVLDEDGTVHIKAGGPADGTGVYIWCNEDYSSIAYSTTENGTKTAITGTASDATINNSVLNNSGKPNIGSGETEFADIPSLTVTTASDVVNNKDGVTSLREAIAYAATLGGTPEITFNIEGSDYLILGSALPKITHSISIDGTNAATGNNVTISVAAPGVIQEQDGDWVSNANGSDYRIFTIAIGSSIDVTLKDMTLIGGNMYHDDGVAETRYGAAVYVNTDRAAGSSLTVDNVTFQQGNSYCAGGLFAKVETVNITNSEFKYNYTPSFGGGFTSESTDVKISDSLFLGNSSGGGSAIRAGAGTLSIERSVFTGNVSNIIMAGGQTGTYSVTDSIFYDNTGTAFNQRYAESTVTIRNSTFVNNTTGAALLNGSVVNSVFWGNDTQLTAETGVSITNSAIEGWSGGGTGNIALQIANTGTAGAGLYYAGFTDPENGNFTLTESSALINRGTNTGVSGQDIAGNTRIQQGTVDIGAYESAFDGKEKASLVVTTTSDVVDAYDNFTSLREAITYAESKAGADEITFAVDGTFKFDSEITISTDITITGNGADKTIFDGQSNNKLFSINSGAVVEISNATLQKGFAGLGGAIFNDGTLTVSNSSFTGNSSDTFGGYGGAIYNNGGALTVSSSTFTGNIANFSGAIHNEGGTLTVSNSSFTGNSSRYSAGAIYNDGGTSTVSNSTFTENSSYYDGAIFNYYGTLTVSNSTFTGNSADQLSGTGGAICNSSSTLTVSNSTFTGNRARSGGAITSNNSSTLIIANSTFTGNRARDNGGAIYNSGNALTYSSSTLTISNSTFTGNSANSTSGYGGAIYNNDGALTVFNSTFTSWNSAKYGSAIYNDGGILNCVNNIFVGNGISGRKNIDINNLYTSTDVTVANTFAEVDADGKAVLDEDGTVHIKAGGPAHGKGVFVWHNEDYSAIAYSQTIDGEKTAVVGDVALATTLIATDQLGQTRTSPTDIGAVISEQQFIEIDPAASNFNCTITAQEYDGTNEVDNASIKVTIGGVEVELSWTSALFDSANVDDVTSATFSGLYSLTPGYILSTDTITVDAAGKILAKEITVSANNITQVYGDAEKTLTYEVSGLIGDDTLEGSLTRESGKNVGDYAISQGTLENSNYIITFTGADYTITKRDLTISANNIVNHTYGTAYTLTFNSDALANGDSFTGNLEIDPADANKSSSGHYAVGDHAITIGTLDIVDGNGADMSDNYTISYNGGTLNITPAEILLSGVTVADKVYDGTANATLNSWSFNSDLANNDDLTLNGNAAFGDKNAGSNKAVNVSDLVLSGSDAGNYTLTTGSVQTTASISKAALEIKANDTGKVYNAADPVLDYTVLSGTLFGDDKITLSREAGENIGEYVIGQYLISDGNNGSNYDVDFTAGKFTIAGKNAVITVGNTTLDYNGTLQDATEYTITGLESGHRVYSIDLEGARNAGSYAVTVESVVIHDASGNDVTGNYHLSYESGTLLINQAQITVNAVEQTITYGETAVPAYTYTGTLFGSDVFTGAMSINGAMNSRNTLYAAGTAKFEIGTLEISDNNGGNNYQITFNGADLTIKAKEISLSAVEIQDKVYDGKVNATILNAEVSGIVAGDDLAVDISGAQGTFASKNAGDDVTVNASGFTLSGADKDNYILKSDEFATSADISKASLAIYAQNVSKTYGDADPKLTYRTEGLVTGDTLNGALERAAGENVGSYAISQGTLENSNYIITFTGAALTITAKELNVDPGNSELIWNISEQVYDGDSTVDNATLYINGMEVVFNNAFFNSSNVDDVTSATFNGLSLADSNYVLSAESITVDAAGKILARELAVKADDAEKISGEADPELTWQLTGGELVGGDEITGALSREAGEDAGLNRYAITQGTLSAGGNYNIVFTSGFLSIKENASLVVSTTSDVVNVYDGVTSLREAVAYAESTAGADEITFAVDGTFNFESEITLSSEITITGNGTDKTIFDGQGSTSFFTINNGAEVKMSDITMQNGYTDGNGGVIWNRGNLTIENSNFTGNSATGYFGGAIYNYGDLTVENSNFTNNSADDGSTIYNYGDLTVENSNFTGNSATGYFGGAIYNYGDLTVENSNFTGNNSASNGGAICNGGNLTVNNTDFTNNSASDFGGAIWNFHGDLTVENSDFTGNNASSGGAISNSGNLTVNNTDFTNNSASHFGGAIWNHGDLTVENSNFTNNSTGNSGGAICNSYSDDSPGFVSIDSSTFIGNQTRNSGGAVYDVQAISNSTFINNKTEYTYGIGDTYHGEGDAVGVSNINCSIVNSTFYSDDINSDSIIDINNSVEINLVNSIVIGSCNSGNGKINAWYSVIDNTFVNGEYIGCKDADDLKEIFEWDQDNDKPLFVTSEVDGVEQTVIKILEKSFIHGSGRFVWHDDSWSNIAVSRKGDGSDKIAIAGDAALAVTLIVKDQLAQDIDTTIPATSIGAYYLQPFEEDKSLTVTVNDDVVDAYDYQTSLREALIYANELAYGKTGESITVTFAVDDVVLDDEIVIGSNLSGNHLQIGKYDSAEINISVKPGSNSRIFRFGDENDTTSVWDICLRGLSLSGGNATGKGGLVFIQGAEVTLDIYYSYFKDASATEDGGAIYSFSSGKQYVEISRTFFENNSALDGNGGALAIIAGGDLTVNLAHYSYDYIWFVDNSAGRTGWDSGNGGAVYIKGPDYGKGSSTVTIGNEYYSGTHFNDNHADNEGGAVYITDFNQDISAPSRLVIEGCDFSSNTAEFEGGALSVVASGLWDIEISDSEFKSNKVDFVQQENISINGYAYGAGAISLYGHAENWSILNSKFSNNSTNLTGGAIRMQAMPLTSACTPTVTVSGCTFTDNTADYDGGALYYTAYSGISMRISGSSFSGNTSNGNGGAIAISDYYLGNRNVLIENTTFTNNKAVDGGAIAMSYTGKWNSYELSDSLTLVNCSFVNNTATANGGAVSASGTVSALTDVCITAVNSTFYGNTAANGGAIAMISSNATAELDLYLINSTIIQNQGGGISLSSSNADSSVDLLNTIVFDNSANSDITVSNNQLNALYSLIGSASTAISGSGNRTAASISDIFATDSEGKVIVSNYTPVLKSNSIAQGGGVYVWHDADWSNIAWSTKADGSGKSSFKGTSNDASGLLTRDKNNNSINTALPATSIGAYYLAQQLLNVAVNAPGFSYTIEAQEYNGTANVADAEITITVNGETVKLSWNSALFNSSNVADVTSAVFSGLVSLNNAYALDTTTITLDAAGKIVAREITVTANAVTQVYGDAEKALTYEVSGLLGGDTLSGSLTRESGKNADDYEISLGTLANSNYIINFTGADYTITKRDLTITANNIVDHTYGTAFSLNCTSSSLGAGDSFTGNLEIDPADANKSTSGHYAVGDHVITMGTLDIVDGNGDDMSDNYTISFNSGILNITPAEIQISAVTAADKVYDGNTGATVLDAEVSGTVAGDDISADITGVQANFASKNVGDDIAVNACGFTLAGADKDNYILKSDEFTASADISKASLAIYAQNVSKTYGDADPGFTAITEGLKTGDTVTGLGRSDNGSDIGNYDIDLYTLNDGNNGGNYEVTFHKGTLTVNAKPITVTADAVSKVYGSADPRLTYRADGLVGNDTLSGSLERAAGENVGTYAINQGTLDNSNYIISFTGAALSITAKELKIDSSNSDLVWTVSEQVYDGDNTVDNATLYINGMEVNWESAFFNSADVADITTVTFNGLSIADSNYVLSSDSITLDAAGKVLAREITVTADNVTQVYGDAEKALTYNVSGLIGDDTLSGSLTRESGKNAGDYEISLGTLANSNYIINFTGADYTITKRDLTITANNIVDHTYGTSFTLNCTSSSLGAGDSFTGNLEIDPADANKSTSGHYAVGDHVITMGTLDIVDGNGDDMSDNYTISFNSGILNITPAEIQISTVTAADKVYDGNTKAAVLAAEVSGTVAGDDIALDITGAQASFASKNAGNNVAVNACGFTLAGADKGNYILKSDEFTASANISKANLTICAQNAGKYYGEADPELTYNADGLIAGDTLSGTLVREPGERTGSYKINQGTLDNRNYNIDFTAGTFTITVDPEAVQPGQNYSDGTESNFSSTIPAMQTALDGKHPHRYDSVYSMEYRDLAALEAATVNGSAEKLPESGRSVDRITISEMTIDNISAGDADLGFSFKTPVKLHRSLWESFDLADELDVYAGDFAEKCQSLKSDFEKLLDNVMETI